MVSVALPTAAAAFEGCSVEVAGGAGPGEPGSEPRLLAHAQHSASAVAGPSRLTGLMIAEAQARNARSKKEA